MARLFIAISTSNNPDDSSDNNNLNNPKISDLFISETDNRWVLIRDNQCSMLSFKNQIVRIQIRQLYNNSSLYDVSRCNEFIDYDRYSSLIWDETYKCEYKKKIYINNEVLTFEMPVYTHENISMYCTPVITFK